MRSIAICIAVFVVSCSSSQSNRSASDSFQRWNKFSEFDEVERYPDGNPPPWRADSPGYPNPWSPPQGRIDFSVPDSSWLTIFILNENRDTVRTITDTASGGSGWHFVQWSGIDSQGDTLDWETFFYEVVTQGSKFEGATTILNTSMIPTREP